MICNENVNSSNYYAGGNAELRQIISTDPNFNKYIDKYKNSDMPTINFADYLVEQGYFSSREELAQYIKDTSTFPDEKSVSENLKNGQIGKADGKKFNSSNSVTDGISIADFSELYEFYPTGDPAQDYQIQMGINYNKTCYNGKNYWDYDKLTAEEDFTGMSAAEIYKAIYEKYQHCYGENFIDINAIPYVHPPHSEDSYGEIIDKFYNELEAAVGDTSERQQARREALYGDMSDYDVRAAIIEKYTSDGKATNADLYKITAEFDRCGVGGGIYNVLIFVPTKESEQALYNYIKYGVKTSVEDSCAMKEAMLASRVDTDLLDGIDKLSTSARARNSNLLSALSQLREACGRFSDGVLLSSSSADSAKDDFVWIKL